MGKKIANVFGILVSIVLSLILLVMLITTPIISGATSLSQEKTIHKLVESIDIAGFIEVEEGDPTAALVDTEFFREVLDRYVSDLLAELDGEPQDHLSLDVLNELKEEHEDELVDFMRALLLTDESISEELLTDDLIRESLDEFYGELASALVAELPTLQDLGVDQEVVAGITLLRSKMVQTTMIVIVAVLSLLILGCRWPRFKGFMWLAVDYILACPVIVLLRGAMGVAVSMVLTDDLAGLDGVLDPILVVLKKSLTTGLLIYLVLAVVFVLVFVFGRKALKKRAVVQEESTALTE